MKWENIAELVEELDFGGMGYLWTLQGDMVREQDGVFRTKSVKSLFFFALLWLLIMLGRG